MANVWAPREFVELFIQTIVDDRGNKDLILNLRVCHISSMLRKVNQERCSLELSYTRRN